MKDQSFHQIVISLEPVMTKTLNREILLKKWNIAFLVNEIYLLLLDIYMFSQSCVLMLILCELKTFNTVYCLSPLSLLCGETL